VRLRLVICTVLAALVLVAAAVATVGSAPTVTIDSKTDHSLTLGSLECGTKYRLRVQRVNADGTLSPVTYKKPSTAACSTPPPPPADEPAAIAGKGYAKVFDDEFTTLDRSTWDSHIWYDDPPPASWGSGFQQVDANGVLHLRTSRDYFTNGKTACAGDQPDSCNWPMNTITTHSSGRLFQYGYFEARMNWTGAKGSWPAFWLISDAWANGSGACPGYAGEIDVMEGQGVEPDVLYGTVHSDSACGDDKQNGNNWQPMPVRLADGWHTYGVLWTPGSLSWYVDDKLVMSAPTYATDDTPMMLLLQEWVGGWSPDPDASTPDVMENDVDWVRVWQP